MTALDYERVENDLHQHLNPLSTFVPGGLQNTYGWSTGLGLCYFLLFVFVLRRFVCFRRERRRRNFLSHKKSHCYVRQCFF